MIKTPVGVDSSVVQNCEQCKCNLLSMGFFDLVFAPHPMLQGHWGWELLATNLHCPTASVLGLSLVG